MRLRLNLEYDGAQFQGWQVQPNVPTVQGALEKTLTSFYGGREVRLTGAGRTDTGVHAVGQVAHADVPEDRNERIFLKGVNALLPPGIRVWRARQVEESFHARYQAYERIYGYRLLDEPGVFGRLNGWCVPFGWDSERAQKASSLLMGMHDFTVLSTKPDPVDDPVCEMRSIEWIRQEDGWLVRITADRFLRRLVRTIVGTLVEMGAERLSFENVRELIETGTGRTGVPAPPEGLALLRVRYPTDDEGDRPGLSPWGTTP
ncbi:MAG: tRNA pseudouridine(38-40) synthase TruA [bacterium]